MKPLLVLLALTVGLALPAWAQTGPAPTIAIEQAWARATPGGSKTGAVYLTLKNTGASDDQLVGASTPVATTAQPHSTSMTNGVMRMRPLASVDLKPGSTVTFAPGGMHVMLMGLKHPLKAGDRFPLTLKFAKAGARQVEVAVAGIGAMKAGDPGVMGAKTMKMP